MRGEGRGVRGGGGGKGCKAQRCQVGDLYIKEGRLFF